MQALVPNLTLRVTQQVTLKVYGEDNVVVAGEGAIIRVYDSHAVLSPGGDLPITQIDPVDPQMSGFQIVQPDDFPGFCYAG